MQEEKHDLPLELTKYLYSASKDEKENKCYTSKNLWQTIQPKIGETIGRGGKKNPNPLAHPNPPTNCSPKPTYLINGQMGASSIRPN